MYVWVDALTNYITGVGFPDDAADVRPLLAGRPPRHRQGHRPLPRGLLAGLPDVGRAAAAEARLRPRLPVQPRREDVEVGRQRRRSVRPGRRLWRRSGALFLPARGAVRPGRQLQPRGDRPAHQRRSRQRPRQPRAALAVDDRQELRRRAAGAGDLTAEDRQMLGQADGLLAQCRAAIADAADPPGAERDLGGRRRGQPLLRRRSTLGAAQDRSGAHGDGALRHGGGDPAGRRSWSSR